MRRRTTHIRRDITTPVLAGTVAALTFGIMLGLVGIAHATDQKLVDQYQAPIPTVSITPEVTPTPEARVLDWTGDTPPEPDSLPLCQVSDDEACYYPGRALGDRCDWVNSPGLVTIWFFNCDDPSLNGIDRLEP